VLNLHAKLEVSSSNRPRDIEGVPKFHADKKKLFLLREGNVIRVHD